MNILYIRHGKDKKGKYKYDEKLSKEGKEEIRNFTLDLIEKYGIPDIIFYSPFYRTFQTKKIMIKVILESKNVKIENKVDIRLGRFFTYKESKNPVIHPKTSNKEPIIYENSNDFHERVNFQFNEIKKLNKNIWNITHSLVILSLAKRFKIERNPHVNYLDYINI